MLKSKLRQICHYWFPALIIFLSLIGCATTTKPNTPYQGPIPEDYNRLIEKNPLLAQEVLKLPEIQDGIDSSEEMALAKLVRSYLDHSSAIEIPMDCFSKFRIRNLWNYY